MITNADQYEYVTVPPMVGAPCKVTFGEDDRGAYVWNMGEIVATTYKPSPFDPNTGIPETRTVRVLSDRWFHNGRYTPHRVGDLVTVPWGDVAEWCDSYEVAAVGKVKQQTVREWDTFLRIERKVTRKYRLVTLRNPAWGTTFEAETTADDADGSEAVRYANYVMRHQTEDMPMSLARAEADRVAS